MCVITRKCNIKFKTYKLTNMSRAPPHTIKKSVHAFIKPAIVLKSFLRCPPDFPPDSLHWWLALTYIKSQFTKTLFDNLGFDLHSSQSSTRWLTLESRYWWFDPWPLNVLECLSLLSITSFLRTWYIRRVIWKFKRRTKCSKKRATVYSEEIIHFCTTNTDAS